MSDRKETPDILGSVLGEPAASRRVPDIMPEPARQRASARRAPKKAATKSKSQARPKPGTTSTPQPQIPPVVWEYKEVMFYDYGGFVLRYVDGRELPDWKSSLHMSDFINQLGGEGWEMVSLLVPKRHHLLAVFKRSRAESVH